MAKNGSKKETTLVSGHNPLATNNDRKSVVQPIEGQYTRVETIDPSLAKTILESNTNNRPVSSKHVAALARDMAAGKWRLTHQGIALSREGKLIDGQHRLHAIVDSGTTQQLVVTYNVDPAAFHSIDVSLQPRSISQVAALTRGTRYAVAAAAAAKVLWHALDANLGAPMRSQWTESEVTELLDLFEADITRVNELVSGGKNIKQASVVAALAFALPIDRPGVEFLITKLKTREGMTKTMASFHNAMERLGAPSTLMERMKMFVITLKAVQYHLKGENDLSSITVITDNPLAQPVVGWFKHRRRKLGLVT